MRGTLEASVMNRVRLSSIMPTALTILTVAITSAFWLALAGILLTWWAWAATFRGLSQTRSKR